MARAKPADPEECTPLFVRLPRREADLLDRAAFEGGISKRALVTELVRRSFSDPAAWQAPGVAPRAPRLGRVEFRTAEAREVLTLEQAAELLQVAEDELSALAESGALPGRRIGAQWRFARSALIAWLGAGTAEPGE